MAPLLSDQVAPPRRRGDEHALFRDYRRDRDPAVRTPLVERYLPLARHLARRYPSGREGEDVLQVASLALLKAIDRFDPDRGAAFTSFAISPAILGEISATSGTTDGPCACHASCRISRSGSSA
jgi:RNA polymerase sigma-B factor